MKTILIVIFLLSFQSIMYAQSDNDSIVLKKYIGGKPYMIGIMVEQAVAKNWGVIIKYSYGDCSNTYDYLINDFENENKKAHQLLKEKYGLNWEKTFRTEVLMNSNDWYIGISTKEELFNIDTLNLSFENQISKIEFQSNRTFVLSINSKNNENQKSTPKTYNGNYTINDDEINLIFQDKTSINFKYETLFQKGIQLIRKI